MKSLARLAVLTAVVGALALTGVATAAHAAGTRTLPVDNSLYAITCPYFSDAVAQTPNNQVLAVNEQTAVAVVVGGGTEIEGSNCAGSPALDPTTGIVYSLVATDDYDFPILVTVNLVTGVSTKVADVTDAFGPTFASALAIGLDGAAYVLYSEELYSLNLTDGVMTVIGTSVSDVWSFVSDPVTGLFYAVDEGGELFEVDVTDGSYASLVDLSFLTDSTYSLTMDANGVFWLGEDVVTSDEYRMNLWSFTLADPVGSAELVGELTVGAIAPFSEALVIGPKYIAPASEPGPALAETGTETVAPTVAGIVFLAAGVVFTVVARRRVRRS